MKFLCTFEVALEGGTGQFNALRAIFQFNFNFLDLCFVFKIVVHGHSFNYPRYFKFVVFDQTFGSIFFVEPDTVRYFRIEIGVYFEIVKVLPLYVEIKISSFYGLN